METSDVGLLPTLPHVRKRESVQPEPSTPLNGNTESRSTVGTAHLLNVHK